MIKNKIIFDTGVVRTSLGIARKDDIRIEISRERGHAEMNEIIGYYVQCMSPEISMITRKQKKEGSTKKE